MRTARLIDLVPLFGRDVMLLLFDLILPESSG